ncbi:MAG: polyphosphate kinase 1 [Erysipelotrichaceae bacterium]|nr:polyphosphate kinase 1 [Erysipelotrichaceae bacterium]
MLKELYKEGYTQNRELSWLRFNERCLLEATDPAVPLLERLKFVAIFSSNLDEFFSVRVGVLIGMKALKEDHVDNKTGLNAARQLKKIYAAAAKLCQKREEIYKDLKKEMRREGIFELSYEETTKEEKEWLKKYFLSTVQPVLGAQIIDGRHPLPPLQAEVIYCAAAMEYHGSNVFALAAVPSSLNSLIRLPSRKEVRFLHIEDLIQANMGSLFRGAVIKERFKFSICRNAAVDLGSSLTDHEDYRIRMLQMLKKRKRMDLVKIEASRRPSLTVRRYLDRELKTEDCTSLISEIPLDHRSFFAVGSLMEEEQAKRLSYPSYTPKLSPAFRYKRNLFSQILKKDVLLSYPYESMEPFLQLVKEAASDPSVLSIRITIYRLAKRARLVDYLCLAAENGKEVTVLIELKARFDEQNNIDYSEKLMDAGCNVMYGFEEYKVHSKICLISRKSGSTLQHVALIATGNFNENTARQYTDLAYLTADPGIINDALAFFRNMMLGVLDGKYRKLLVAPVSLKQTILQLIERETAKGESGRILAKVNAVTDEEIIRALKEASCAGVRIDLIVRGISCILPEVKGKTENIHIRSIVGRYLEHSRVYVFGSGRSEKMYIASADFMTRNTERRVEIAVPIVDKDIRQQLHTYLDLYLQDNVKARKMSSDGRYRRVRSEENELSAQDELMKIAPASKEVLQVSGSMQSAHKGKVYATKFVDPKKKKKNEKKD